MSPRLRLTRVRHVDNVVGSDFAGPDYNLATWEYLGS